MKTESRRMDMMKMVKRLAAPALACFFGTSVSGMSAPGHLNGLDDLGGVYDLDIMKGPAGKRNRALAKNVMAWMDNPATRPGTQINIKAGGELLSPWNHGAGRHRPRNVVSVFVPKNDNGVRAKVVRAVARIHKIQDIAHNTAPVDGWPITDKMSAEAREILRHLKKTGRLPNILPAWVDAEGPLMHYLKPLSAVERANAKKTLGMILRSGDGWRNIKMINGYNATPKMLEKARALAINFDHTGKLPPAKSVPRFIRRVSAPAVEAVEGALPRSARWLVVQGGKAMEIAGPFIVIGACVWEWNDASHRHATDQISEEAMEKSHMRTLMLAGGGLALCALPIEAPVLVAVGVGFVAFYAFDTYVAEPVAGYIARMHRAERYASHREYYAVMGDLTVPPEVLKAAGVSGAEFEAYTAAYKEYLKRHPKRDPLDGFLPDVPEKSDVAGLDMLDFHSELLNKRGE